MPQLGGPYWSDEEEGKRAKWKLATVIALTLGTTGVRYDPHVPSLLANMLV